MTLIIHRRSRRCAATLSVAEVAPKATIGGFFAGDKAWTDTVYRNVGTPRHRPGRTPLIRFAGHYFASRGFLLVAMNYRLVPHAKYPAGGEDVGLALEWIRANINSEANGFGDPEQIVFVGQSAGGAHIATYLYQDGDADRVKAGQTKTFAKPAVKGVAYLSAPFFFNATIPRRAQTLRCAAARVCAPCPLHLA
jgi:hypothetical protein